MSQAYIDICSVEDLVLNSGICALVSQQQVAIFAIKQNEQLSTYCVGNYDPIGDANVLYRGIIGSAGKDIFVASPLYKQRFCLSTGACLDDAAYSVPVYPCKIQDGRVLIEAKTVAEASSLAHTKTTDNAAI